MRLSHSVEWIRAAQGSAKPVSVRTMQSRLQRREAFLRLERLERRERRERRERLERRRLSESTVQALMHQAQERLAAEQGQAAQ
jgi:hypothetical protein